MKKISYKIIDFGLDPREGYLFEVNERQFALFITECSVHVHDLKLGARVLWYQQNDLLMLSIDDLIEFAKVYISKITKEQWLQAEMKCKTKYPSIDFPINKRFRI